MNEIYCANVEGTGASIDIYCGFVPAAVKVVNLDSATMEQLDWYRGMADASAVKTVTGTVARTKITSLGITPLGDAASDATEKGFRIGADTDVNVSAETMFVIAYRGGAGNQF